MMRKLDDLAQAGQMLLLMVLLFIMILIFGDANIRNLVASSLDAVFTPVIGFSGENPLLTIVLAGVIVVFLSSFFTHLFTNWKAMGQAQEASKAFNKEITKARKEGNTNRLQKLMYENAAANHADDDAIIWWDDEVYVLFIYLHRPYLHLVNIFSWKCFLFLFHCPMG